jgi:hypothetical protein
MKTTAQRTIASKSTTPRLRLRLLTAGDCRKEIARIYRQGKSGERDVSDVSKLANVLAILNRCIETGDFEQRILKLEVGHAAKS